jgi:hypothetical protein
MNNKQPLLPRDTCRTCGKPIVWIVTANDKRNPCDPDVCYVSPNGNGKRWMLFTAEGKIVQGFECKPTDVGAQAGYRTHFATCNHAAHWRGRPRGGGEVPSKDPEPQPVSKKPEQFPLF